MGKKGKNIIWITGFILLFLLCIGIWLAQNTTESGQVVVISQNGKELYRIPVTEHKTIRVEGEQGGENQIVIDSGSVSITQADCPDKLCVKQGSVRRAGVPIVCLPHRLVAVIEGRETDERGQ
ncbi:MAG: NusG domain II-containing protein [Clostridia bacterium]|nr:NusG domain II-containing protein [Clostridia bacterium]